MCVVPEDSTEYWVDDWVIPAGANNPVAAHAWINSVFEPAAAAKEMSYHQYVVPVKGVRGVPRRARRQTRSSTIPRAIERYETQIQTPNGQRMRDRSTPSPRPPR